MRLAIDWTPVDAVSHRRESSRSASPPRTEADRQSERGPSHEVRTFDLPASIWAGMPISLPGGGIER